MSGSGDKSRVVCRWRSTPSPAVCACKLVPAMARILRRTLLVAALAVVAAQSCSPPFKTYGTNWCLSVTLPSRPLTWFGARGECQKLGGDLASLEDVNKFQELSAGIDRDLPELTKGGYTFWIGAQRIDGVWKWVTGNVVEPNEELWIGGQPSGGTSASAAILVPAGGANGRRYLTNFHPETFAPAFVCEK